MRTTAQQEFDHFLLSVYPGGLPSEESEQCQQLRTAFMAGAGMALVRKSEGTSWGLEVHEFFAAIAAKAGVH